MPRLPSYTKKKATEDRAVVMLSLDNMKDKDDGHYGLFGSPTQVQRIFPPESDVHQEVWNGDDLGSRLYDKLNELKFI